MCGAPRQFEAESIAKVDGGTFRVCLELLGVQVVKRLMDGSKKLSGSSAKELLISTKVVLLASASVTFFFASKLYDKRSLSVECSQEETSELGQNDAGSQSKPLKA